LHYLVGATVIGGGVDCQKKLPCACNFPMPFLDLSFTIGSSKEEEKRHACMSNDDGPLVKI
jgi:hypothetical protein